MKRPTKGQVALSVTQIVAYYLVALFVVMPLVPDTDNWAWWKYLVLITALAFVANAVNVTVRWAWDLARDVVAARKAKK